MRPLAPFTAPFDLPPRAVDPGVVHDDERGTEDHETQTQDAAGQQPRQLCAQCRDAVDLASGSCRAVPADADDQQAGRHDEEAEAAAEGAGPQAGQVHATVLAHALIIRRDQARFLPRGQEHPAHDRA